MSEQPVTQPILVDKGELANSIAQYKNQSAIISAQLQQLEQQKTVALKTIDMLSGAVQALEQLVTNITDREKAADDAAKAAAVVPAPSPEPVAEPATA
jgi:hypothetical protein